MRVKLGDICEINPKRTPEDLDMNVSFIPMQRVSDQGDIDTSDIRSIKEVCKGFTAFVDGDILMAKITPCMENGKGAIASGLHNGIGYGSTEFHVLRPNQDLFRSSWIYYFTIEKLFRLNCEKNMTGSAGQKRVPKSYLQGYPIPLPSLAEQDMKIATLDRLRQIIILYKSQLQKLDDLVKARFVEMFVKKDVMEDWPEKKIMDISTDMRTGPFGSALLHDEFVDSGIFVLGIDNAVENKFSYNRMRYITEEKYQQLKRYTVNPDDVIITIMGTVGRSAVIPRNIPRAINTKHLACITLDRDQANPYFLSCAFQIHPVIRTQLQKQSKGAIMDGLNLTIIKRLSFSLPPIDLQEQFVDFYNQIDKSKAAVQQALDKTQQLFDSLMQQYFA